MGEKFPPVFLWHSLCNKNKRFSRQQFVTEKENYMNNTFEVKRGQKVFYFDPDCGSVRKATVIQVFKTNTWYEGNVVIVKNGDGTKNITRHHSDSFKRLSVIMTHADKILLH